MATRCLRLHTRAREVREGLLRPQNQRRLLRKLEAYLEGTQSPPKEDNMETDEQNHKQHKISAEGAAEEAAIAASLKVALEACSREGELPPSAIPVSIKVQQPSKKHLKASGVAFTTAVAHPVSAASLRVGRRLYAAVVADLIVRRLPVASDWIARTDKGHINFFARSGAASTPPPPAAGAGAPRTQEKPLPELGRQEVSKSVPGASHRPSCHEPGASTPEASQPARASNGHDLVEQGSQVGRAAEAGLAEEPRPRHLEVRMVRSSSSLVDVELPLYQKYQTRQHGDPAWKVTRHQFKRFLVDTPLVPVQASERPEGAAPPCGFGSFHQQYWLDGVLVAVGVVDILPRCLSSKYFFWDPDLAHLSLGKVSAMREIEWVREASRSCPSLHYYYMGYYIHTCPKMQYKIEFAPADLLCPRALAWIPFSEVRALLDSDPGTALVAESGQPGIAAEEEQWVDPLDLNILFQSVKGRRIVTLKWLIGRGIDVEAMGCNLADLNAFAKYAGPAVRDLTICM